MLHSSFNSDKLICEEPQCRWNHQHVKVIKITIELSSFINFHSFVLVLDLKAFERRLTEVLACLQPNCLRWRIVLCLVTLIAGISAFFWLRDPATSILPFFDSLLNHYIFTTSALTLITLFGYGIHKLVISPQVIDNYMQSVSIFTTDFIHRS